MPMGTDRMRVWRWSKKKLINSLVDIEIVEKNNDFNVYVKDRIKNKEKVKTMWYGSRYDASSNGTKILQKLNLTGSFSYPKSVYLMKDILEILTDENDIVLDYHLGSGTTAAVAHKMGRKYIGIEQMDYIEDVTIERMKKVVNGEQGGVSKEVDWQGGGSFVYCELMENANELIDEIQKASEYNIDKTKEKIYSDDRIIPYVTKEEVLKLDKEFDSMDIEEKKKSLISLVDKNKLYVNYSDIEDETYEVADEDKKFTESFYKKGV
ncbi:MAG: DNA methyltransferase [Peptoniphilaceae bacterium]